MVALADVRRWDAAAVEAAFTGFGAVRDRLLQLDFDLAGSRPPDGWRGTAADAARAEQERLAERLRRVVAGLAAVRPTVAAAADAVAGIRRDLAEADAAAAAGGFAIGPDGTVRDVRQTVLARDQVEEYQRQRTAVQTDIVDRVERVLRRAAEVDTALADVLRRAAAERIDDGTGVSLAGAERTGLGAGVLDLPGPPAAGDPAASAAWWNGLTGTERDRVLAEHPEWVGNRDGIPAAARDDANRTLLATEITRVDRELADAEARRRAALDEPLPPGMEGQGETRQQLELRQQVERLRQQRAALLGVQDTIAPDGRQLLALDLAHDRPRAAVAVGDVDTADHVAVFTPGMESDVAGDLGRYTEDMRQLRQTALNELRNAGRGDETVATVAWLGYEPPRATLDDLLDPAHTFATDGAAERGGADLARFLDGVDASRAADPHLTALGHSYGSTTTGHALQHAAGVDDAVLFGSPGVSTGDAADLRVPAGHVAVIEARGDAVADLGSFGGDANQLDGVVGLSAREEQLPGRPEALRESTGHSAYLTPGTASQYNIASTVAGLHGQRIERGSTGLGDWLRAAWDAF